jgi:hypothetical protein
MSNSPAVISVGRAAVPVKTERREQFLAGINLILDGLTTLR